MNGQVNHKIKEPQKVRGESSSDSERVEKAARSAGRVNPYEGLKELLRPLGYKCTYFGPR